MITYVSPKDQTVIGVTWMKGDSGYIKTHQPINLKAGDKLTLELTPEPSDGKYSLITLKNGMQEYISNMTFYEHGVRPPDPHSVDKFDYLLEEK